MAGGDPSARKLTRREAELVLLASTASAKDQTEDAYPTVTAAANDATAKSVDATTAAIKAKELRQQDDG